MRSVRPADYLGCPATVTEAQAAGRTLLSTGWGLRDAAIALGGTFACSLLMLAALSAGRSAGWVLAPGWYLIVAATVPWIAMVGWPMWVTRRFGNGPRLDLGLSLRRIDVVWGLLGGLVALAGGLIAARVTEMFIGDFSSIAGEQASKAAESSQRWQMLLFGLIVAVGAPFAEELVFRGMLWAGLARLGMRPVFTLLATTIVFAFFHFEFSRIGVLLVIGLVLGALRLFTQRLGASMVAHGMNNLPGAIGIALA